MINIKGIDKAEFLAAIYNHAKPLGMGFLHYDSNPMTTEQAQEIINGMIERNCIGYIDYLKGRCIKCHVLQDEVSSVSFDEEYGEGALQKTIDELREKSSNEILS